MKKRLLSFLLVLCMVLALLPGTGLAAEVASGTCGDNLTWTLNADGTLTISGTGAMTNYWACSAPWYGWHDAIITVVINNGVTSIGDCAFYYCDSLTSVTIPNSVTSIGGKAFSLCESLTSATIPNSVTSIGDEAFWGCSSLTNVTIPDSVTSIGMQTFYDCSSLTSVSIPNCVTSIGVFAFYNCSSLTDVYYGGSDSQWKQIEIDKEKNAPLFNATIHYNSTPATLTSGKCGDNVTWSYSNGTLTIQGTGSMRDYSVYSPQPPWYDYRAQIHTVKIDDGVTSIGKQAFGFCEKLTSVTIPNSVISIGTGAFLNCYSLTSVTIPDSVTSIEYETFSGCSSLTRVTIPDSVTDIGSSAFWGCSSLASVTIPNGVASIKYETFGGCSSLTSVIIPDSVTRIEDYAFDGCSSLTSVTIPDSITIIESCAFILCSNLTSVTLPDSVTSIGASAFYECSSLTDVYYGGSESQWKQININAYNDPLLKATIHYNNSASTNPTLSALTYSFDNSNSAYGYSYSHRIPLARYQLIFGNTTLAKTLYNNAGYWGGNCYGMSSTTSMFFVEDNGVSTTSFKSGVTLPSELSVNDRNNSWNLTLTEFIEAMQISQSMTDIQKARQNNLNQLNQLCQAVSSFQQTGTNPVMISIRGPQGGHAIVGYDIVDVSTTESRLMVYDCNYPKTERYITLTKNSSGQYTDWYYHLNDTYNWGNRYSGSSISYYPYSLVLASWNNRGGDNVNMLTLNVDNAVIKDVEGDVVASIRDGEILTDRNDIYPIIEDGITADGKFSSRAGVSMWVPTDDLYTVTNTDRSVSNFEATLVNVDQSATVVTTASEIVLGVSDDEELTYAQLPKASDDSYTITFSSNLGDGYHVVQLTGTAGQGAVGLAQMEGKLYGDVSSNASLQVDGTLTSASILVGTMSDVTELLRGTELPFTDVSESDYYYKAVAWAVGKGITSGTSATTFSPNNPCTRAQIVTFLYRAAGSPAVNISNPFTDVGESDYYYYAVLWAVKNGITSGTSATTFSPDKECTRAEAVTFLYRAKSSPAVSGTNSFTDVTSDAYYAKAVQWAVNTGVTAGTSGKTFSPNQNCTRAQIVTFLYRDRKG